MVNGLLFHMTQPTSRSIIKAIACSKPTISEHWSKWKLFNFDNKFVYYCYERTWLTATNSRCLAALLWWLLFVRAWSLLVVRSIDCCSCPEPSCLSVERLSFIEAWVNTALWPKCSCCLVFSYVLCIVCAGCFCRTTIVMTIFWSLVCWNSVL